MAMNPSTASFALSAISTLGTVFAEKGKVKALKKDAKAKTEAINISQASTIKYMQETFLTKIHDFNNAYAVSMGEQRNNYEDVEAQKNLASIGMNGTSYASYSKSILDTQYQDLLMNSLTKHQEDYSRMNRMNKNQMDNTLNRFGQERLDTVNALYTGINTIHAETQKAIMQTATQGAIAGYEHLHAGSTSSKTPEKTLTSHMDEAKNFITQVMPMTSTQQDDTFSVFNLPNTVPSKESFTIPSQFGTNVFGGGN